MSVIGNSNLDYIWIWPERLKSSHISNYFKFQIPHLHCCRALALTESVVTTNRTLWVALGVQIDQKFFVKEWSLFLWPLCVAIPSIRWRRPVDTWNRCVQVRWGSLEGFVRWKGGGESCSTLLTLILIWEKKFLETKIP